MIKFHFYYTVNKGSTKIFFNPLEWYGILKNLSWSLNTPQSSFKNFPCKNLRTMNILHEPFKYLFSESRFLRVVPELYNSPII